MIALDLSLENLYRQYIRCRKNKRNTVNALRFEALVNRSYQPGRSVCFFTTRPKLREIFAADFRDRVVHHVLVDYLERIWEPIFIHDSWACRKGKGVHAGVMQLQRYLRQVTANGTRPAWYLRLDIRNYFMSIDKQILLDLLAAKLKDDTALWLTRPLVNHDCTPDYVMRGAPDLLARIPPHKTLFGVAPGKGLPIGNLNSQFFANVYLNGLDQFVKHELKCRNYLRYCDDFVLLAESSEQLTTWRGRIEAWLHEHLRLELNPARCFFERGEFPRLHRAPRLSAGAAAGGESFARAIGGATTSTRRRWTSWMRCWLRTGGISAWPTASICGSVFGAGIHFCGSFLK